MNAPLKIILADDDKDDQFIFAKTLSEIPILTQFIPINNGERLMKHLSENIKKLPDVIFLDLNMPRKNGSECLTEIKQNKKLKDIPVVIYSTSFHKDILDLFYKYGAYHCICKSAGNYEIKKNIRITLKAIVEGRNVQPPRENFALGFAEA